MQTRACAAGWEEGAEDVECPTMDDAGRGGQETRAERASSPAPSVLGSAMGLARLYDRHVLPSLIEVAMRQRPIMRQREKIVPRANGRVLEIGVGSGLNLSLYDPERVERVLGVDPSSELGARARDRASRAAVPVEVVRGGAEGLEVDTDSVDTVLMTYTLCTIPDRQAALAEMRRVLRPDGQLLFCEHALADDPGVRRWQRRITPVWSRLGGGCRLDVDVPELLRAAGFELAELETLYLPGFRALNYNTWGVARIAG